MMHTMHPVHFCGSTFTRRFSKSCSPFRRAISRHGEETTTRETPSSSTALVRVLRVDFKIVGVHFVNMNAQGFGKLLEVHLEGGLSVEIDPAAG